ncbi:hypothetical protein BDZ89DRAFT_1208263 [Hymenopellis radicata]|nr:hypothetical protein BDZ89DRAFT_1208263 [Hymenopellis radicata]
MCPRFDRLLLVVTHYLCQTEAPPTEEERCLEHPRPTERVRKKVQGEDIPPTTTSSQGEEVESTGASRHADREAERQRGLVNECRGRQDGLRIRHKAGQELGGARYTSPCPDVEGGRIHHHRVQLKLINPITMTHATVLPRGTTYITGDQSYEMNHAVLGFASSREGNIDTILDMSSLQFGDAGRGLGGKSLFALESLDDRVETIARGADTENARTLMMAITPAAAWLAGVAKRVKERWDKRHQEHSGGPAATQRCSKCGGA